MTQGKSLVLQTTMSRKGKEKAVEGVAALSLGTLSVLPRELLFRVLDFLGPAAAYLDVRLLSRAFRELVLAYLKSTWTVCIEQHDAEGLADAIRAIQLVARKHSAHMVRWASPHHITHRAETSALTYYDPGSVTGIPDPVSSIAPKVDISAPRIVARILRSIGYSIGDPGAVGFIIDFASRLYSCSWFGSADLPPTGYYASLHRAHYKESLLALLSYFDGDPALSVRVMRSILELGRPYWMADAAYRRRSDDASARLASFLKRFPKFVNHENGSLVEALLEDLRGPPGSISQFSADEQFQVLSLLQNWAQDTAKLPGRLLRLLTDRNEVPSEIVSKILGSLAAAGATHPVGGLTTTNNNNNANAISRHGLAGGGEDTELWARARNLLSMISTRGHFPAGQLPRLGKIMVIVAETGAGYRRTNLSMMRTAELLVDFVAPLLLTESVDATAAPAEFRETLLAIRGMIYAAPNRSAPRIIGGTHRAFASLVAALVDIWAMPEQETADGLLPVQTHALQQQQIQAKQEQLMQQAIEKELERAVQREKLQQIKRDILAQQHAGASSSSSSSSSSAVPVAQTTADVSAVFRALMQAARDHTPTHQDLVFTQQLQQERQVELLRQAQRGERHTLPPTMLTMHNLPTMLTMHNLPTFDNLLQQLAQNPAQRDPALINWVHQYLAGHRSNQADQAPAPAPAPGSLPAPTIPPIHRWTLDSMFEPSMFTLDTIFHTVQATPTNHHLLHEIWKRSKPDGSDWTKPDFLPWKSLLTDLPMEKRKEARKTMQEVQSILCNEPQKVKRQRAVVPQPVVPVREGTRRSARRAGLAPGEVQEQA